MIALAGIMPRHNVLEPSAGTGAIVEHLSWNHAVTAVELNKRNYDRLSAFYGEHVTCLNRDFLLHDFCGVLFDRVVMNPPHKNCVTHIEKAAALLREGGRLVALIHVRYADEISSFLPDVRKYYLPRDTFSLNDEYIESVIIVWDKGDKV
jgi:16S rRNA A1518/A1519 N6-dimethyltransferase RsmA/KsgA/DIM1 with predicted DNA glycosylase/AP lyase activity